MPSLSEPFAKFRISNHVIWCFNIHEPWFQGIKIRILKHMYIRFDIQKQIRISKQTHALMYGFLMSGYRVWLDIRTLSINWTKPTFLCKAVSCWNFAIQWNPFFRTFRLWKKENGDSPIRIASITGHSISRQKISGSQILLD